MKKNLQNFSINEDHALFILLKKRDREKASISKQNGIKLVYINYWEEITPELIKSRVENADV